MLRRDNFTLRTVVQFFSLFILIAAFPVKALADYVKIMGTPVNIRQGPGTSYPVVFQAEAGQKYPLIKLEGLWGQIATADGQHVWVFRRLVDILPDEPANQSAGLDTEKPGIVASLKSRLKSHIIPFFLVLSVIVIFLKRQSFKKAANLKMQDISGYGRNSPFRYDGRPPEDDKWEM